MKFVNKNLLIIFLSFIFLFALVLRFYQLEKYPSGFHVDEASLGYNAYSILKTGKDDNNNFLPLYIDMFGDQRPSGYHLLSAIPVMMMGLTVAATRFSSALFGTLLVLSVFFLAFEIFQSKKIALLSSLITAISPWGIVISRASGEAIVALFFISSGVALFLRAIRIQNLKLIYASTIIAALSFFFYHTPRVFVPILFLCLIAILFSVWRKFNQKLKITIGLNFVLLCLISLILVFVISGGTGRFSQVNIFSFPETKLVMEEQIKDDGLAKQNLLTTRIFHNKIVSYSQTFFKNYFDYYSGNFLFINGGLPRWYIVPNMGLVYLIALPFLILGILFLATSKNIYYKIPLLWLIVAPITASITVDDIPNVNRAIAMSVALEIIIAAGVIFVIEKVPKKYYSFVSFAIILLFVLNLLYFLHQYTVHAPLHRNWYRNDGTEKMVSEVSKAYDEYDHILVTKDKGGIYPLILFYTKYVPAKYQSEGSQKDSAYKGFGKFIFVPQSCPKKDRDDRFPDGKILYVENGSCKNVLVDPETKLPSRQEYIRGLDGVPSYHIVYD